MFLGGSGYFSGAWNSCGSADISYVWFGKFAASGRDWLGGGLLLAKSAPFHDLIIDYRLYGIPVDAESPLLGGWERFCVPTF